MKFTTAYYLLVLYTTVMFNPLIPLIKDAVSHAFEAAYHIATVHARYGNDHLEKELADTGEGQSKNQGTIKQEEIFTAHIPSQKTETRIITTDFKRCYSFLNLAAIPVIFLKVIAPPPKYC